MERIGLSDIHKDEDLSDSWEFEKAVMRGLRTETEKNMRKSSSALIRRSLQTDGWKEYPLVYAGRGKEADYDDVDVTGCLVMVDINQRDEWVDQLSGISGPLKAGAAAVIAVQDNGYGEIDSEALNAQGYRRTEGRPGVFHVEKGCGDP